jgi:hypothetical protein
LSPVTFEWLTGEDDASEPAVSRFSSIARVLMRCNGILTDCGLAGCHCLLHLLLLLLLLLMRCVTCMLASCSTVRSSIDVALAH